MRKFLVVLLGAALLSAAPISLAKTSDHLMPTVSVSEVQASGGQDDCSRVSGMARVFCEIGNAMSRLIDQITADWNP